MFTNAHEKSDPTITAAGSAAAARAAADAGARDQPENGARLHVVLGAGGGAGAAVVRHLARRGLPARAVSRDGTAAAPSGVAQAAADIMDEVRLARAIEGADVVYHCAQPPYTRWVQDFAAMTRAVVRATAAVGAKLVFADNLYMYGPQDGPLTEKTPVAATSVKGRVRAAMSRDLLQAHREGLLRVAIGRSSDYYGPGGLNSAFGERQLKALTAGKKVQWFADLDQPHTMSFLDDVARALVLLGECDEADGRVWHLPAGEPLTGRQFVELAARVACTEARPAALGLGTVRFAGLFMPVLREFPELWYQWDRPFISDWSEFARVFGSFTPTPHDEALRRTVTWYREATGSVHEAAPAGAPQVA
jgi:nucleoside-diphosphate-sugar epimerase